MTEPSYFCPQCGPLRWDGPGHRSPIDSDGLCGCCGATTCSWPDLVEHLKDEGFELRRDPITTIMGKVGELYSELDDVGKRAVDAHLDRAIEEQRVCPRTYPLDPLTAEDPCEDCGRDQRKHEIEGAQPQLVAPRYAYVEGVDPERDARLRADGFTPVQSGASPPSPDEKLSENE